MQLSSGTLLIRLAYLAAAGAAELNAKTVLQLLEMCA